MKKLKTQLSIKAITQNLATDAYAISQKWKTEREKEEATDLILASLT